MPEAAQEQPIDYPRLHREMLQLLEVKRSHHEKELAIVTEQINLLFGTGELNCSKEQWIAAQALVQLAREPPNQAQILAMRKEIRSLRTTVEQLNHQLQLANKKNESQKHRSRALHYENCRLRAGLRATNYQKEEAELARVLSDEKMEEMEAHLREISPLQHLQYLQQPSTSRAEGPHIPSGGMKRKVEDDCALDDPPPPSPKLSRADGGEEGDADDEDSVASVASVELA